MVLPGLADWPVDQLHAQLEAFHPLGLLCGIILHATMSIGFGLVGGVLLPTLPPIFGGPLLFGGFILPLLWSGINHSLMGVVNPLLNQYIAWPWYVASQLVYGIATSIVILRCEKIAIAPRGPGGDAGGPSIPSGWLGCWLIVCLLLSGCSSELDNLPGKPTKAEAYVLPQDVKNFHELYAQRCAGCHGADGTLGPGPPLADPMYVALTNNDELVQVIASGRNGTLMPAWSHGSGGPLTDQQVSILATGIKQQQWKSTNSSNADASKAASSSVYPSAPPLAPPAGTKGSASNGQKVFATACAACHGDDGTGTDDGGSLRDHAFLALCSDQILRRYIITGRHDLGMPDFADKTGRGKEFQPLADQQVTDLVALLASWRNEPSETVAQTTSKEP
jgi:mono/diheme cytochrome c family protein